MNNCLLSTLQMFNMLGETMITNNKYKQNDNAKMQFKVGDRAIYQGEESFPEMTRIYGGDTCTILEVRGTPFDDCKVAFDSFPNCHHREYHNWFYVDQDTLQLVTE